MIPSQTRFPSLKTEGAMELCSIEDAFPNIQKDKKVTAVTAVTAVTVKPGHSDLKSSKEERRAARRLARKCKDGPAEQYYKMVDDTLPPVDPDRPAIKRMGEIPAYVAYEDAFNDLSGTEGFKMPRLPAANCLISNPDYPTYFGKGLDDTDEGFTNMFSDSAANVIDTSETFEYEFGGKGADKAGAVKALPAPPITNNWKPVTPAKVKTAFYKHHTPDVDESEEEDVSKKPAIHTGEVAKPPPQTRNPRGTDDHDSMRTLMANQIKDLTQRFEDLEAKRERSTKNEVMLFVGTGFFILVCMDIVMRMARH